MSDIKLLHGDCYEIIPTLPDESIDLCIIDPPYNFDGGIHGSGMFSEKNYKKYGRTRNINMLHKLEKLDSVVFEPSKMLDMLLPKMKSFYGYFFCNKLLVADYIIWAKEHKFTYDILTLVKCLGGMTEIWCKNQSDEIFKSTLKDLYKHTDVKSVRVFNGNDWVHINSITKTKRNVGLIIKLYNGNYISCTPEHKFFVNGKEVEAKNLEEGMVLDNTKIEIPEKEASYLSGNLGWFIGYFIANGSYSRTKIQIATNQTKSFVVERIRKLCEEYNAKYFIYDKPKSLSRTIVVSSPILRGALEDFVAGERAQGKHLSKKAYNTNKLFLKNILIGYLEGDGFDRSQGGAYSIGFTRRNVALKDDLISICNILGFHSCIKKSSSICNGKKFSTWHGSIYLREIDKHFWKSDYEIKEIRERHGIYDFYDLSLTDPSHKFSLSDGTLTHNCNPIPAHSTHHCSDLEYIILIRGKGTYWQGKGLEFDDYRKWYQTTCQKRIHPAEKPVELLERFVRVSCPENGTILDCFMGSGSTGIACLNNGRNFIGVEKDDEYFELAKKRIKDREDEINGVGTLFEGIA